MIWRAAAGVPAEIRVNLDNQGLGWFTLAAKASNGDQTDLRRTDDDDADGMASFLVTPSADLLFKLRVLGGNVGSSGSEAWMQVLQAGAVLECHDANGKTLNKSGASFTAVKLGAITQAHVSRFNFSVWS